MITISTLQSHIAVLNAPDADGVYRQAASGRAQRTAAAVEALSNLWKAAVNNVAPTLGTTVLRGIGLAAVGSLARGQLGPHSDLDLVLIYDEKLVDLALVKKIANGLWYPVWDAGLSLDYSVRSVRECIAVTDADLPAAVGWLEVLPIAGDSEVITSTSEQILSRWRKAARTRLGELKKSASARGEEFGSLPYLSQPNLKEARGGLRDSVLIQAVAASWLADRPHGDYDAAVQRLLDVRDCLQIATQRESTILLSSSQARVAALLGLSDPTLEGQAQVGEAQLNLQVLLAKLGRRIAYSLDATLSRAQHSLLHEPPRFAFVRRRAGGGRVAPRLVSVAQGVSLHEGQVVLDTRADVVNDHSLALRVGAVAARRGLSVAPITVSSLELCPIGSSAWDEESRRLFLELLASGPSLIPVWESLDMARVPSRLIPEWDAIRNRPSGSAVHRFTIDRHQVEVVSKLGRFSPHGQRYSDEHFASLLLAGIFHDIGKRSGRANLMVHKSAALGTTLSTTGVSAHAEEGARQASAILSRMGFEKRIAADAVLLIRNHLALSDAALTGDPSNEETLNHVAQLLKNNPVLLDMLFDLTRADSSSLGATPGEVLSKKLGWSDWRRRIITQLYEAVRAQI